MAKKTTKKPTPAKAKQAPKLDPKKRYTFVSNGKGPGMVKGKETPVGAQVAAILIEKGYGDIKEQ